MRGKTAEEKLGRVSGHRQPKASYVSMILNAHLNTMA